MKYMTLADELTQESPLAANPMETNPIALAPTAENPLAITKPAGYDCELNSQDTGNNVMLLTAPTETPAGATLRDGSLERTSALMMQKARSPLAIGTGITAGAITGYRIYPRATRRFGRTVKGKVLTGAGAVVAGMLAHGISSYFLMKWGG